jgi:hypothetical protein
MRASEEASAGGVGEGAKMGTLLVKQRDLFGNLSTATDPGGAPDFGSSDRKPMAADFPSRSIVGASCYSRQ